MRVGSVSGVKACGVGYSDQRLVARLRSTGFVVHPTLGRNSNNHTSMEKSMALMILLRLPSENDLDKYQIDFEGFYSDFIANSVAPFIAKVEIKNGHADLKGSMIPPGDWFTLVQA